MIIMLSIVVPVKNPPNISLFIEGNLELFRKNDLIVIDSGGGKSLEPFSNIYVERDVSFWDARKLGYERVETKYILNLDCDVVVPNGYIKDALVLLEKGIDAVSIFYENISQGVLEYGVSIWKTDVLQRLYDFSMNLVLDGKVVKVGSQAYATLNNGWCECTYMWRKLKASGGRLETFPYRAKHLDDFKIISK